MKRKWKEFDILLSRKIAINILRIIKGKYIVSDETYSQNTMKCCFITRAFFIINLIKFHQVNMKT